MVWPEPPDGGPPIAIDPDHPEHPIVLPPIPPEIWPKPEAPTHPIVIPVPPEIWPKPGVPTHPIVIPPRESLIDWTVGWSEETGWVVVGIPNVPAPTPSKE
jgi:hypothetical protein